MHVYNAQSAKKNAPHQSTTTLVHRPTVAFHRETTLPPTDTSHPTSINTPRHKIDDQGAVTPDTCWGKIFHEEITPASVFQVLAPRIRVPASGSRVPAPRSGTFLRLPSQVISLALR
ncbi:hypothetical protein IGI04_029968 [Brassica rapa subsp. trilocularis]|uniref:Uncharacterized protein n=1 Tax=Brassica rapa subsp. trilocularis TaxID=1813537 RepID=A0ABQ7LP79_BRACM|nr:hypothetical protein IGI04_029914 [Brassica rapa subsp. trilocularis]KAG5388427.1 hypothetical protein IGI04_029968 [Brassica rapa subsp. trilocularis]